MSAPRKACFRAAVLACIVLTTAGCWLRPRSLALDGDVARPDDEIAIVRCPWGPEHGIYVFVERIDGRELRSFW